MDRGGGDGDGVECAIDIGLFEEDGNLSPEDKQGCHRQHTQNFHSGVHFLSIPEGILFLCCDV